MAQPADPMQDIEAVVNQILQDAPLKEKLEKRKIYVDYFRANGFRTLGDIHAHYAAAAPDALAATLTANNFTIPSILKLSNLIQQIRPPPPPPPESQQPVPQQGGWTPPTIVPDYPQHPYAGPNPIGGFPPSGPHVNHFGNTPNVHVAPPGQWNGPMYNPVVGPTWGAGPGYTNNAGWNAGHAPNVHTNVPNVQPYVNPNYGNPHVNPHVNPHPPAQGYPHGYAHTPSPLYTCVRCQQNTTSYQGGLCQGCWSQAVCSLCRTYQKSPQSQWCTACQSTQAPPQNFTAPQAQPQQPTRPPPPQKCSSCGEREPKSAADTMCQPCTLRAEGKTPCQDCQVEPAHTETHSPFCVKCKCKVCQERPPVQGKDGRCAGCDLKSQGKRVCTTCKTEEAEKNYGECSNCKNRPIGGLGAMGMGAMPG